MASASPPPLPWKPHAFVANGRYAMGPSIARGSFGSVHVGIDTASASQQLVAIKVKPLKPAHEPQLKREYAIYVEVQRRHPKCRIRPAVHFVGAMDGDVPFRALVMEMMGPSLGRLHALCKRALSLKTVLVVAEHMLVSLQRLHDAGFLHRDIKPKNFVVGAQVGVDAHKVFAIDLGLATRIDVDNEQASILFAAPPPLLSADAARRC